MKYRLGEIVESISVTKKMLESDRVIFLNTGDILDGKILHNNYSLVKGLPGQAKKSICHQDILYSEIRPKNKRYAYIDFDNTRDFVVSTKLMVLRTDKSKALPKYIYYFLTSSIIVNYLQNQAESRSGTFPQITFKEIKNIPINLPVIKLQKRIVNFLDVINDKLELNNQIIDTLEEIASTLFKRWFVDFEFPDENGNPYKSSGGKMIDSELGEIPEGWETGDLSDISEIIMGQSPKSNTYNQSKKGLPLVNGASDFKQGYITPLKYTTDPRKITKSNDYIFGVRATIGNVTYVDGEYAIGRGAGIARVIEVYYSEYLYFTLNALFDYFRKTATGSVYINISKKDFEKYQIVIPSIFHLKKYHNTVGSLFYKIRRLREENMSLLRIRDELLPRLLSGNIEL